MGVADSQVLGRLSPLRLPQPCRLPVPAVALLAQLHNSQGTLNFPATMSCPYLLSTDTLADKSSSVI